MRGDARVTAHLEDRAGALVAFQDGGEAVFGIGEHGAELEDGEGLAVLARRGSG